MKSTNRSMKDIVNEAMRIGLTTPPDDAPMAPFEVRTHDLGLRAGIDPDKLGQLLDDWDVDDFVASETLKARAAGA
ncbi:MAG: hypothetical protein R2729_20960 [Bryobacteraceae bacterium]